jgi:hypothetical protein
MRTLLLFLAAHLPIQSPVEINQLNDCIQTRFLARTTFGMSRIVSSGFHGVGPFQPENPTELAVVQRLEQQHYQVALYLAGRNASTTLRQIQTTAGYPLVIAQHRFGVQDPAFITGHQSADELPRPDTQLEDSQDALKAFENGEGYNIKRGDWNVALRPLRASNQACVDCHNNRTIGSRVHLGDPLGVVMYVYRRKDS